MRKRAPIALAIMALGGIIAHGQSSVDLSAGGSPSPAVDLGAADQTYSSGAGSSGAGASRGRSNAAKAHTASVSPALHGMRSGGTYPSASSSIYKVGTSVAPVRSFASGAGFPRTPVGFHSSVSSNHSGFTSRSSTFNGMGSGEQLHGAQKTQSKKAAIKALLGPGQSRIVSRSLGLPDTKSKP
jgi:hypothetical protein